MDFRKRDRLVEGCNWLMVGVAAGWVAYTFAGSFSSPADSAVSLLPPTVVQQAPSPTELAPVFVWGNGTNNANPSNPTLDRAARTPRPSAASLSNQPARTPSAPPQRDPTAVWEDAPYVVAPEIPIDPLSTLPPGVGPDF